MKILFFNRSFYPDIEATGQLLTELCEDLAKRGHEITVITGKSYHVDDINNSGFIQSERYKSIEILRTKGTVFPKKNLFFRLLNLGTYFLIAFFCGFFVKQKPDVVISLTDPPLLGLYGIFFSKWYRARFIYYCNDIYPDVGMITSRLRHPIYIHILQIANILSFKYADVIICLGEDMKKRIISKGVDENKITVIHSWADTNILYPVSSGNLFKQNHLLQDNFVIMYSGNIGFTQDLDKVLDVAEKLQSIEKVRFVFVGEGADKDKLQSMVGKRKIKNVEFLPYQPKEELNYSLNAADIHLITLRNGLAGVLVPSKVYGIMACGKPFIAWVDKESDVCVIAKKFNAGMIVPPGNIEELISAINWAMSNEEQIKEMGLNGRKAVVNFFDRKIAVDKFEKVLINCCLI